MLVHLTLPSRSKVPMKKHTVEAMVLKGKAPLIFLCEKGEIKAIKDFLEDVLTL